MKILPTPDENADTPRNRSGDPQVADVVAADGDANCQTRANDLKVGADDLLMSDAAKVATTQATTPAPELQATTPAQEIMTLITDITRIRPRHEVLRAAELAAGGESQLLQLLKSMRLRRIKHTEQSLLSVIGQLSYDARARNELWGVVI